LRFHDFLKATVLLSGAAATLLAALTIIGATQEADPSVVYFSVAWWGLAALAGAWLGRRAATSPPIARLLATARAQNTLPEQRPGLTLVNRLWPLLVSTLGAGILAFFQPQVAGVAAGFAIIWALSWRRQEQAVLAIEERDAVRFYVDTTSPISPIQLIRTPGWGGTWLKKG
jgi:MYXO-CTERM domain-containing protein